jgi:NAD(P)-dependent dehydrogenase (short-subunit alcohol dehydrogenase family)
MDVPVVLITGALTGIGRATAIAFARKGAKVVVSGRRDEAGEALVDELRPFGSEAEFIKADVRSEEDVRVLVDATVARFGHLDVAVNHAGTEGQVGPIVDQTADSVAATFDTNVLGVVLSMKHEVRAGMLTRFTGTPENKADLLTEVPMARLGLSDELANTIVFIASDEASFITGHILNVDGGHSAN